MSTVSLADAKARLSELIGQLADCGEFVITRHGQPVARLSPVGKPKQALPSLAAFRARQVRSSVASLYTLRELRDEQR
jgi:prevent-host-death family protein